VCFTASTSICKMSYMMLIPLGFGILPGFSVCLSLSRDFYMPKWQPDGDVMVCSGHFLNPAIRGLNSRGFVVGTWGGSRLHWCCSSSHVCSNSGSSGGIGSPQKILFPKFDSPPSGNKVARGSII